MEGESITDDDLAAYIVQDLRLLMVGETRILKKSNIAEAHKRNNPLSGQRDVQSQSEIPSLKLASDPGCEPKTVSTDVWHKVRSALLYDEKALTRAQDRFAADRRRLLWQEVADRYLFETPGGQSHLSDLFEGRDQLIGYHHMLQPADPNPCPGCSMFADSVPHLAHLHARNTS